MQKKPFFKMLSIYLAFAMVLLTLPGQGWAMFLPTAGSSPARQADMNTIQKTLESKVVQQRLMDYGLSPEEAMARINTLPDDQVHRFAANMDSVQAGADGLGAVAFVLVVAILVILILELTGHHVIFR